MPDTPDPNLNPNQPIPSSLVDSDPDFYDLVAEFVSELPDKIGAFNSAVESGDIARLKTLAHQMKGSAGGYGYDILSQKAAVIEQFAAKEQIEAAAEQLEELRLLVARVVVAL